MTTIKSIEEKAKCYDKALERAKKLYGQGTITESLSYVFPELKESEDEKIRKRIISALVEWNEKCSFPGDSDDMIAWLEKKGEQKETLCDKCKKTQPSHSCQDITALGRCALEKQGEQKLTEFEKAVKQVMEEAIECGDTHNLKADADMLLSLVHNSSWSEEDEKKVNNLYVLLDQMVSFNMLSDKDATEFKDWLKSLKNRVQPQLKQEWSEEDKKIIDRIESEFLALHRGDYKNIDFNDVSSLTVLNWVRKIKSLRFQNTWKPSDEQIKTLENVRKILHSKDIYSKANSLMYNFEELIRTIKKLKE